MRFARSRAIHRIDVDMHVHTCTYTYLHDPMGDDFVLQARRLNESECFFLSACAFSATALLSRAEPYGLDTLRYGKQKDHCAITSKRLHLSDIG